MDVITLGAAELAAARAVADHRQDTAELMNASPRWGQSNNEQGLRASHYLGTRGELAVAKYLNCYWDPGGFASRYDGDVGQLEVRATRTGFLFLHDTDPDERIFVAVRELEEDRLRIMGWCRGLHGKVAAYWNAEIKRPAYTVPFDDLSLPELLRGGV